MKDLLCNGVSVVSMLLINITGETIRGEVTEWVTVICTVVITLATLFVQAYRIVRDKDADKTKDKNKDKEGNE